MHYKETQYGFEYGDAKISRFFSDERKGWVTLVLESSKYQGHDQIQLYITKTGKVRIFSKDGEWFPDKKECNFCKTYHDQKMYCRKCGNT